MDNWQRDRLAALDSYDILDTPAEPQFDRIVRLIKDIFDIPMAIVSVIDGHRQWYKAYDGLGQSEVSLEHTFCRHTLLDDRALIVEDATNDSRFSANPHVTGQAHIRFYAGTPLTTPDGHNIGSICAIDTKPRRFTARETRILNDLAAIVMREMELRRDATIDVLTEVMQRRAFEKAARQAFEQGRARDRRLACLILDIDHFKAVNDTYGHPAGDIVIKGVAKACRDRLRQDDLIGRIGGEEFAIILHDASQSAALNVAEELRKSIQELDFAISGTRRIGVTTSIGLAFANPSVSDIATLIAQADTAMYKAKTTGRNRVETWRENNAQGSVRRRVLKGGRILFNDRQSTMDCTVRWLSDKAAGLDVSSAAGMPPKFILQIPSDNLETYCRIVLQTDRHVEVEFC